MDATRSLYLIHKTDLLVVQQFIQDVEQQYLLLNLYSTKGIGKTTFLSTINADSNHRRPTAFVRVQDFVGESTEGGYRLDSFLFQIFDQLQAWNSPSQFSPRQRYDTNIVNVLELAEKIVGLVQGFAKQNWIPLIIIDDYDRLLAGSRTVFENVLLSKILAAPNRVKVILSSEQELQFTSRFDLRIRLKTHKLEYLTEEDIQRSVPMYADLANEIRIWTGGMPDLVGFFVQEVNRRQLNSLETHRTRPQEIFGPAYRKQIQETVFSDVRIVSEHLLDVLAILRRFDVAILSDVLPKVYPDTFASFKQKHYLDLIRELGSRVSWQKQGGYALDQMLRVMLFSYVKTFVPTLYQQVNLVIVNTYETWLEEDYRPHYVVEMLYHLMLLDQLAGNDNGVIVEHLKSKLLDAIQKWRSVLLKEKAKIDSLKELLSTDDDLRQFINLEVFDALIV